MRLFAFFFVPSVSPRASGLTTVRWGNEKRAVEVLGGDAEKRGREGFDNRVGGGVGRRGQGKARHVFHGV